jgi:hypothetical protein
MSVIEKFLRREIKKQIVIFMDRKIEQAVQFLSAALPAKAVEMQLVATADDIVIEYTEIGWIRDSAKTLSVNKQYAVERTFDTGDNHSGGDMEKIEQAEVAISFNSSGKLDGIDFAKTKLGIGVSIHAVKFRIMVSGKLKYGNRVS